MKWSDRWGSLRGRQGRYRAMRIDRANSAMQVDLCRAAPQLTRSQCLVMGRWGTDATESSHERCGVMHPLFVPSSNRSPCHVARQTIERDLDCVHRGAGFALAAQQCERSCTSTESVHPTRAWRVRHSQGIVGKGERLTGRIQRVHAVVGVLPANIGGELWVAGCPRGDMRS
jgi:hypothetical protein